MRSVHVRPGNPSVRLSTIAAGLAAALVLGGPAHGGSPAEAPADCPKCAEWLEGQTPFRIYGNTYYVGTHGLSSILVTSAAGDVLIDGALAEAAPQIQANIRALGFKVQDIRLILNSHVHFDHAGGIAALQRASGAQVAASPWSAVVLRSGHPSADDPQYAILPRGPVPVAHVRRVKDGETLSVGPLRLTAHFTPGHTPGGTTWTWESCEQDRCLHLVYADSLSAISAPGFQFSDHGRHPRVLADFAASFAVLSALPCDILLTPHPEVTDTFGRLQRRDQDAQKDAFLDPGACRAYAERARAALEQRLAEEKR